MYASRPDIYTVVRHKVSRDWLVWSQAKHALLNRCLFNILERCRNLCASQPGPMVASSITGKNFTLKFTI